jgi:hypothetical protein
MLLILWRTKEGITLLAAVDLQGRRKEFLVGLDTRRPPQP